MYSEVQYFNLVHIINQMNVGILMFFFYAILPCLSHDHMKLRINKRFTTFQGWEVTHYL